MKLKIQKYVPVLIGLFVTIHYGNAVGPVGKPAYSTTLETALRTELFTTKNYEVLQRPEQTVTVGISLTILTVNTLNIKDQMLSISGYLSVVWNDSRLDWSNSSTTSQDYSNVNFLFSTETYVWRPALIIENSVVDISIISDDTVPMRIVKDGKIIWNPSGIYQVSCESDTTYYPLDTQHCTMKVSSWAYTSGEVRLEFDSEPVDLNFYSTNGEWDLISATGSKSESKSRGGASFSSLTYAITLQRRPLFHILNTLFPVALMAVLIAMVFKLPVDSGEKIGFSLTVLLAYAVYLTMISDNIPSTSVTVCYLSVYLVFILVLGVISVCLTIFVLNLQFRPEEEEVPKWLKKITKSCLLRLICMKTCKSCCKSSKVVDSRMIEKKAIIKLKDLQTDNQPEVEDTEEKMELTWQQLSKIMDNVFFNVYITLIAAVTIVLFLVITVAFFKS